MNFVWKNIHIFIPLVVGMIMGRICPMNSTGSGIPRTNSQPPGWVFGIVWPILYILIGLNWNSTKNDRVLNLLHWALVIGLNVWLYVVGCNRNWKQGVWTFIPIVGVSFATWILSSQHGSPLLLVPFLAWILFAQQLNVHIVEKGNF